VFVSPILAAVLKSERAIVAMGLAGVATLAWIYLIYMDWGMRHMDVGMNMIIMPAMQHLDRLGPCPGVSDVGSHDGCDDDSRCQPGNSAFY
jgi:predicted metal-binding membrane protein